MVPFHSVRNPMNQDNGPLIALRGEVASMDLGDPEADARSHMQQGDLRIIGIYGYSVDFPGTPDDAWGWIHEQGFRGITGTSDMVWGPEHLQLIETVREYATRYNRYVWTHGHVGEPRQAQPGAPPNAGGADAPPASVR